MVHFNSSDYAAIAKRIFDATPWHESSNFEATYMHGSNILCLSVEHEVEFDVDKGDYVTPSFAELKRDSYDVLCWEILGEDDEIVESDFTISKLLNILN